MARVTREDVHEAFTSTLWLPDTGILDVTLGTVAGNRMAGLPVWTLFVGAPGAGKTVMLDAVRKLPETYEVDTFTEAGLLSGSRDGTLGLLPQIGAYGILVFPDLTVLLSKHSTERSGMAGSLRRIYDGSFDRWQGSHGGHLYWEGKVGLLGAVTQDVYIVELGVMGERFLYHPLPRATDSDRVLTGHQVLDNLGEEPEQRDVRSEMVARFFDDLDLPDKPPAFTNDEKERLVGLADLGARCRSPVRRDRFKGDDVELVPDPELPTRLVGSMSQLAAGMRVTGTPNDELWRLVRRTAIGGVHPMRRQIIEFLVGEDAAHVASTIGARCRIKESTCRRYLDDLVSLEILDRFGEGPVQWRASEWLSENWWPVIGSDHRGSA